MFPNSIMLPSSRAAWFPWGRDVCSTSMATGHNPSVSDALTRTANSGSISASATRWRINAAQALLAERQDGTGRPEFAVSDTDAWGNLSCLPGRPVPVMGGGR